MSVSVTQGDEVQTERSSVGRSSAGLTSVASHPCTYFFAGLIAITVLFADVFAWLASVWSGDPEYSHGFVVPVFAAYCLWVNRATLRSDSWSSKRSDLILAVCLVGVGLAIRLTGIFIRAWSVEAFSLIPFVIGLTGIVYGKRGMRWVTPAALFLVFMIPLPRPLAGQLGGFLQWIATDVSTFALQTLGIPAFSQGNVIKLTSSEIGVAEACSGLRMLNAFFALTVGACLIIDRSWLEKLLIALSAGPIAILANCIRIIATGIICEVFSAEAAQFVFHDVAGWLMVPLGFLLLTLELALLDRLLEPEESLPAALR